MLFSRKLIVACVASLVLIGCTKGKLNKETVSSEDHSMAESLFEDIFNTADRYDDTETDLGNSNKTDNAWDTTFTHSQYPCLTITKEFINTTTWERKITLDFGSAGCTTADGKVRKGKIIAHRIGKYREEGSVHIFTTENYFVDDYGVEGERKITNLGNNSANQPQFQVDVNGDITNTDNENITWESHRVRTWIEGNQTWVLGTLNADGELDSVFWNFPEGIYDDVWEVTGTSIGINRNGRAFDVKITTALRFQWCDTHLEVTEGIVEIQPEDLKLRVVDFGDQTCDNQAKVTIDDNEQTFNFRN